MAKHDPRADALRKTRRLRLTIGSEGAMSARELHEQDLQRGATQAKEAVAKRLKPKKSSQTFDKEGRVVRKGRSRSGVGGNIPTIMGEPKQPRGLVKRFKLN